MEEVALVLATSVGPIAAVLTLPDAEADAVMLIVPGIVRGGGGTRAGVNQVHVRIARAAANHRVATLRADYAGMGESWDADPHRRSAAVRDLARWACERTGDVPLLLVANCFGLSPALSVCRERPVAGVAMLLPPVLPARALRPALAPRPSIRERFLTTLDGVRSVPRRIGYRVRYGPASHLWRWEQAEYLRPVEDLCELVSCTPTWMLMGSRDTCSEPVQSLLPRLRGHGHVDVTVIAGLGLHAQSNLETQDAICDNVADWVARSVTSREPSA